ncbi:class I SAM-dependent methyltransferase [Candidatus Nomurabacteria bacterium]|nr:class I SAM-dependent methyltransferase [Candidatus Nomurabacteria bacterium]
MKNYQSYSGRGMDIAENRADDLDRRSLAYLAEKDDPYVFELGSGSGGQAVRMVAAGACVVALDVHDFTSDYQAKRSIKNIDAARLRFISADMRHAPQLFKGISFDAIIMQRVIHYLSYQEALQLLSELRALTSGSLFISVTGLDSMVGDSYPLRDEPLESRFGKVTDLGQDMFGITEPICLYTEVEFTSLLMEAGWQVEDCWTSAFGNHKAVCR